MALEHINEEPVTHIEMENSEDKHLFGNKWFLLMGSMLGVASWSLAGNLCRIALQREFERDGLLPTYATFGPNAIGSFMMGLFTSIGHTKVQTRTLPWIYSSILVGFCGSLTTFSSWLLDMARHARAAGGVGEFISGLTMPFVFFVWGRDVGRMYMRFMPLNDPFRTGEGAHGMHWANIVFVAVSAAAAIVIPIAVEVAVWRDEVRAAESDRRAVVLAPAGAVVRFGLSLLLNKRPQLKEFPLGTFLANMMAIAIAGALDGHRCTEVHLWSGIAVVGLCGSLSTMSSLVNEVLGFYMNGRPLMAYLYAFISVGVGCVVMVLARRIHDPCGP